MTDRKLVATLVTGDQGPIQAMAYAPDARAVAIAADRSVQMRDAKTGEVLFALNGHADPVTCLAFSPDGQTLATGSDDKTVKLWDRATGKETRTLPGHADAVQALAFSTDGTKLAIAAGRTIKWWDPSTGKELATLNEQDGAIRALAVSPDGRSLASGSDDGTIRVQDLAEPGKLIVLKGHAGPVRALTYAADGTLASGGDDATVKIWEPAQARERHTLTGTKGAVLALAFSPTGRSLVSAGDDGNIHIWDPVTGQRRGVLSGHKDAITALAIHPNGSHLLSASLDSAVLRWNAGIASIPPVTLDGNPKGVWFAQFSPDGERLATGGLGGTVTLWTRTLSPATYPFQTRNGVHRDAAFSPDGRTFATSSMNDVQVCDAVTGQVKRAFVIGSNVRSVAYSPDSRYLAAGMGDQSKPNLPSEARLFDLTTGEELARMTDHQGAILRVQFSPDGKTLATSARDKTIRLWEVPSGKPKGILRGPKTAAKGMVFLADGTLVTAGYDGMIRFWDVAAQKERATWNAGMGLATLDVSPDGALLAAAEAAPNGKGPAPLKIWDVTTGKVKLELKGHTSRLLGVSFTRDGRGLVAAGGQLNEFGEISYYDLASGQLRGTQKTPRQWLEGATLSVDGRRVLSPSAAGLHHWHLDFTHEERTWKAHNNSLSCGLFLDGGRVLATASWDNVVHLWDVRKAGEPLVGQASRLPSAAGETAAPRPEPIANLKGHKAGIRALAVGPDGKTLFSGSEDRTLRAWDLASASEKTTLQGNKGMVYTLAVAPDGKTLASGGGDHRKPGPGELILWDLESGTPRKTIAPVDTLWSVAFSPDGKLLAGGTVNGIVQVWNLDTGTVRTTLKAPYCRFVTFAHDGKWLASSYGTGPSGAAPGKGGVRLWDTATWKEQTPLAGHDHVVFTADFSPGGETLASASQDGTIKLWPVPGVSGPIALAADPGIATGDTTVAPRVTTGPGGEKRPVKIGTGETSVPPGEGDADVAAPPKTLTKLWLALAITLFVALGLSWVAWRYWRPGRDDAVELSEADLVPNEPEVVATVTFRCSGCGKRLRAKASAVGKKVKCPQCAQAVQVPRARTGSSPA